MEHGWDIRVDTPSGMPNMLLSLISVIVTLWASWAHGQEITCDPPAIANGLYTPLRTKYRLEDVITYRCDNGFSPLTRRNKTRCTDGGWAPPPRCIFKPCEFPKVKHGNLYWIDRYRGYFPASVGQRLYYTCDDNYVTPLEGNWSRIICTPRGWLPEVPCLRKCVFRYLEYGYSLRYEQNYLQGESIRVFCLPGYSLPNQQTTMTCTENGWFPPPKCIRVVTCLKSDIEIENGFFSESQLAYPLHTETQYKCKQGYLTEEGQTSGTITCLQRGWSAHPRCIKSCDMPVFENARARSGSTWFKVNDRLDYECQDGYTNGDGHTTSFIVCGHSGWSGTPSCHKKECVVPDIEQNLIAQPRKEKYFIGDVLKFSCRQRLKLVGPDSTQCYNFGWSPDPPTCKAEVKPCGPHPQLPNGTATNTLKKEHEHGEVVEYVCNPRFLLKGSRKTQCVDGEWTSLPQCIEENSTCEVIPHIVHGSVYSQEHPYHHGESVTFSCRGGFTLVGPRSVTCLKGKWTQPPQCIDTGNIKTCKLPRSNEFEPLQSDRIDYDHNEQVNYTCRRRSEQKHSVCINGRWDPQMNCGEIPRCAPPPQIPKSQNMMTTVNYQEGETISILCQDNSLILEAGDLVCQGGIWKSVPRCIGLPCGPPPLISNGAASNRKNRYEYGEKFTYHCARGFSLHGPASVICSGGKWSPPPECIKTTCPSPPSFDNAEPINVNKNRKVYQSGDEVAYRCRQPYQMDGSNVVRCMTGRWIGTPTCRDNSCGSPPIVKNATIQNRMTRYQSGDRVRYKCMKSLDLFGDVEVTCLNGKWTDPPQCKESKGKCGRPPTIDNGDITTFPSAVYAPGDSVEYKCQAYYKLQGNRLITCHDGEWSEPPKCLEPCVISEEMMEKFNIRLKWRQNKKLYSESDDSIEFTCRPGYRAKSPPSSFRVTCRAGKLTYPTCE